MGKEYHTTPDEEAFFAALDTALTAARKSSSYTITRMANGALSVSSRRAYLGKVKLQGRKTWMQYMTGPLTSKPAEDEPLEEYIRLLKYWVKIA